MNNLKYIVGEFRNNDFSVSIGAVIFPETMTHADVARSLRAVDVLGAGFFYINDMQAVVYGRSGSLNVDSRPEDLKAINKILGFGNENG